MRRDDFTMSLDLGHELIIDNFAGGGGTSTGLEEAFGRPVDIAINHDPEALALHAVNHPHTRHLCESVWDVDPIKVTNNQPVGLVWLSPDCKHFSKAKGGTPVAKNIRGLAWVTLRWAAKCKPRVIMLENVEEFKTWGPLLVDAEGNFRPDPAKKGKTFESFLRQLRGHGYKVDHKELRASDYDTPTIRKRFFLVARRDGLPIRWPAPTNGAPTSAGVLAGNLAPWRTAAECIDWSIRCPSIFERKRPLAEATMRRIAKGIMRYVVDSAAPFIVGQGGPIYSGKPVSSAQPFGTLTTENHRAVVVPSIVPVTHQGGDRSESVNEPFRTITSAQRGEKALATATLVPVISCNCGETFQGALDMPCPKCGEITSGHVSYVEREKALAVATMVQTGYGERDGQAPRALDIEKPLGTVVAGASKAALVTAFLNEHANGSNQRVMPANEPLRTICAQVKGGHFSAVSATLVGVGGRAGESRPRGADEPAATITAKGDTALVTAHITKFRTGATGSDMNLPVPTITAGPKENPAGAPHALGIVTANLVHMGHGEGTAGGKRFSHGIRDVEQPLNTVTASGVPGAIVTSSLVKLRGTSSTASMDEPLHTVSAGGQHHAEVRAFLVKYYGTDQDPRLEEPLHTVTTKDRYGLVTIQGVDYVIVDIGLRMLEPAELYRAQGFPADYVIREIPDPKLLFVDGHQAEGNPLDLPRVPLTKSAQVRMCGNSVCPPMARALIHANFMHEREIARVA
ncbi:DNA cytosine methyltransferase [Duganella sp. BJB476]|uniref:DNA cytosine methyltransferase n=1 Tax=Duganella sp. BJB476 TaxID=1871176 RepID=UPI000E3536F1|nr:DNA cytosine methyltransferase [Duganella sp. BJB476]RFP32440.1 DNA cytosine methyltransferase [Duganella sp. BJB476]